MNIRIRETTTGFVVEEKVTRWTLFGLRYKWIPYVKTTGMEIAWTHKNYFNAINNAVDKVIKELKETTINLKK